MSSIYIQEPPTSGKILLKTSVGDIDIELWAKECPKTCRNFLQLCMDGYYDGTFFHRVVKGFIAQGGERNNDISEGEPPAIVPFKDEFHTRLRYVRRGLVGMANSTAADNEPQFFFTLGPTPELQNKNTVFGKVTGDTLFNMLKLEEGLVDHNERPIYPQKIIKTEILSNPFDDLVPRLWRKTTKKKKSTKKEKGVKNFGLLSFGDEAEVDEEQSNEFAQLNATKAKSLHDAIDDPRLSKDVAKPSKVNAEIEECESDNDLENANEKLERIKSKLLKKKDKKQVESNNHAAGGSGSDSEVDFLVTTNQERESQNAAKKEEIRKEIMALKKQYKTDQKVKGQLLETKIEKEDNLKGDLSNEMFKDYLQEKEKYTNKSQKLPKKGASREQFTLNLLKKFREKLQVVKQCSYENSDHLNENDLEKEIQGDSWLAHTLHFEESVPILAKDASTKADDWYDVCDPRNAINKRKRGENSKTSNQVVKKRR